MVNIVSVSPSVIEKAVNCLTIVAVDPLVQPAVILSHSSTLDCPEILNIYLFIYLFVTYGLYVLKQGLKAPPPTIVEFQAFLESETVGLQTRVYHAM